MGEVKRLDIELSEDLAGRITSAIESGDYADINDVVGEALADWDRKREAEITRLRELIEEGLNSGDPEDVTDAFWEDIKHRGREMARHDRGER